MKPAQSVPQTIDEYISGFPPDVQVILQKIRKTIHQAAPEAQEKIRAALAPNKAVTVHVYPGCDHAFARVGGQAWNAEAAKQANDRTAAFFSKHLS